MTDRNAYSKYRRKTIADKFEGLEKILASEVVKAGDDLNRIKKSLPPDERVKIQLLFSGEQRSSDLDEILARYPCENLGYLRMLFSENFLHSTPRFSGQIEPDLRPESQLNRVEIQRALTINLVRFEVCAAMRLLKKGISMEFLPCYAPSLSGLDS